MYSLIKLEKKVQDPKLLWFDYFLLLLFSYAILQEYDNQPELNWIKIVHLTNPSNRILHWLLARTNIRIPLKRNQIWDPLPLALYSIFTDNRGDFQKLSKGSEWIFYLLKSPKHRSWFYHQSLSNFNLHIFLAVWWREPSCFKYDCRPLLNYIKILLFLVWNLVIICTYWGAFLL